MEAAPGITAAIDSVAREDRGRLLAALMAALQDFQLAEDALQDALEAALVHWPRGIPTDPRAWLLRVARRKAIDRIRKAGRWRDRAEDLAALAAADQVAASEPPPEIPDERLRLIFTCCHPALEPKSRVALTLRMLGGLTTGEIAAAFLDREETMGQRLSRAKRKIAKAGIPFVVPAPEDWSQRLNSVLTVIYLIFNEGYRASSGGKLVRVDLCDEAIWLARMLDGLVPDDAEVEGLLSLMLTTHARRSARLDDAGAMVALDDQDRGLWDRGMLAEGLELLDRALARRAPGPFQIKAAISALHGQADSPETTDWRQLVLLYDALLAHEATAVVRLNRAVALAEAGGLAACLRALDAIRVELEDYQPYHAARADLLARSGQWAAAQDAYRMAIALSRSGQERRFLQRRMNGLSK
ncbi:sigma-70 family RNA polymerase sigma factor [Defluviimonas aestuarii]|uniref:RNA polymerase sigma factor n=1 Tax=Albidovulum aestuarii TaxID=1130726 RepID=UPI00249CEBC2|nr:sigma-70 family RNA polymerase sigma factor [Defluviimonas aestuarii]MDI3335933.1 sigma-70 family RNA polymerase sigma factor [Defluviimonas aestuarii]